MGDWSPLKIIVVVIAVLIIIKVTNIDVNQLWTSTLDAINKLANS